MPLPDAEDTKKSQLYGQFRSQQLGSLDDEDYNKVVSPVFINASFEDEMRRINLVGQASNQQSQSGPIPGTQQITQTTYTSTGDDADFFKPTEGVWMLVGGDTLSTGGTGSINWSLKDSSGVLAFIFQTSVNGQEPIFQNSQNNNIATPIYITPENWLHANITAVSTSIRASISFIRVR